VDVERVAIRWARAAGTSAFEGALQLGKAPQPLGWVIVGVQQIALQKVGVVRRGLRAEKFVFVRLKAQSRFAAEREKPGTTSGDRDVFDRIPEIRALGGVGQKRIVLIVTQ
jgi:hypothetical protein